MMPAMFVEHAHPMTALDRSCDTEAWSECGPAVPVPRAILVVSVHSYVNATTVTSMTRPRTVHDSFRFLEALFDVQYPAPGDPELASRIVDLIRTTLVGLDANNWGIDHGTWSVPVHMFPRTDVPVLQLSINSSLPYEHHFALGGERHALRHVGVFIVTSGNVGHNLRLIDFGRGDPQGAPRRRRELERSVSHVDFSRAVPTTDYLVPLAYLAGRSAVAVQSAATFVDGYERGSLSMTANAVAGA